MTIHTQPSKEDWAKAQAPNLSHRWIVHLLAEMVHYAEEHELEDIVGPLTDAIEQVAPSLACVDQAPVGQNQIEMQVSNVLDFMKRRQR
ncbi:hypothetical protein ACEN2J_15010 [Pseudorhodobacter sp. W20_MBD10_FR17]|uniref:hypothetical protein n=1 Tax=Pseudorhodobacter sp. W20_MBD10_FR17 TaxID=3240266 RepID=UPI003F9B7EE8